MIDTAVGPETAAAAQEAASERSRLSRPLDALIRGVVPVILALVAGGLLLLALGRNPITFYGDIYQGGIMNGAWQDSAIRMAPLLLIAAGLIFVFKANIWNLGYSGQFLLAAAMVAGFGPKMQGWPVPISLVLLVVLAAATGAVWTIIPGVLKAYYDVNEIITTLMMSFVGTSLANILIKGPFQDFSSNVPQTGVLALDHMLPSIPTTRIHIGLILAFAMILVVHYVLTRTAFGLGLQVLGANRRAALHVGLRVPRIIIIAFLVSGALIGMSAAVEILGVWGYVRADWNPNFGDSVIPFVFLARLNAIAVIPYIAFYSVLSIGGEYATQNAGLPADFRLVLVGLILLFMVFTEYLGTKRDLGTSYIPSGMARRFRRSKTSE